MNHIIYSELKEILIHGFYSFGDGGEDGYGCGFYYGHVDGNGCGFGEGCDYIYGDLDCDGEGGGDGEDYNYGIGDGREDGDGGLGCNYLMFGEQ